MRKEISIFQFYSSLAIITLIALAAIMTGINIHSSYQHFLIQSEELHQNYIENQKLIVKNEVDRIVNTIAFTRSQICTQDVENPDDKEKVLKKDFLQRIGRLRFGKDKKEYVFVVSYDGTTLMNDTQRDLVGKNIWDLTDPNGVKVIQEERKAVENPNGDFIYYSWEKPSTGQISPKVSFVKGVPAWEWMIGTGVYLDDIEDEIAVLQSILISQLKKTLQQNLLAVAAIIGLFVLLLHWLNQKLTKDFDVFVAFFEQSAHANEKIDEKWVRFTEFRRLAGCANEMVTEKKKAEKSLKQKNEQLELVMQGANMGWWDWDIPSGNEIYNAILPELLGYHLDEIKPHIDWWQDKVHPDDTEQLGLDLQAHFDEKTDYFINEHRLLTKKGEWIWVIDHGKVVERKADGTPIRMLGTLRDITARKNAEEEIQKVEKLRSVGTLAGGIAHDFNNILMVLFGNISLAKDELSEDHPGFELLEKAEQGMSRARSLTNRLLTFAKGGAPVKDAVSIGILAKEVVHFDLSGSNVLPVFDWADNLWIADVDQGQMHQVFSNLSLNANEAMPDGGHLYITMENAEVPANTIPGLQPGKYIKVTLRDEGIGIDQKHIERIFEPYFSTKQTGSGLGLATTYSIISKHDGYIQVESILGQGTTFTIYLPASNEQALPESETDETKTEPPNITAHILIMDDDEMISALLKYRLERCGFRVELAANGQQTIDMYKKAMATPDPFDVVIMDLTIPGGMGGKEAIQELLKIDPQAAAIVSSGYADDPVMANYADYGFKGVVIKPSPINKLQEVIYQIL